MTASKIPPRLRRNSTEIIPYPLSPVSPDISSKDYLYLTNSKNNKSDIKGHGNAWARDIHGRRMLVRTPESTYDDIISGFAKNEAWGRYHTAMDPEAQNQAMRQLNAQNIKYYDWAYHGT